jgi:apolipoprotein N-acyltransferase
LALSPHIRRGLVTLLVLHAGVFFALGTPHRPSPLMWPVALVPLFLALDLVLRAAPAGWRGRLWRAFACTYPVGVVFAAITGGWVVNTANVYGALPLPLAYAVSWFGYGSLFGLEFFLFLGLPFLLSWRRPLLALFLVPLWATVLQVYVPRFLGFFFGQAMYTAPPLVQFADVLGSGGLNLLWLPLQLIGYGWLRRLIAPGELPLRALGLATAALALLFAGALGYGWQAMELWERREAQGRPIELVGIQPNFSLRHLASNPALSHSDREQSLRALLEDSAAALERAERTPGVPTVLIWPESVYPRPYFLARGMREVVELWVASQRVHLILASQDGRSQRLPDGRIEREAFGVAVHLGQDGAPRGLYRKIALIPWGETIPGADWIPGYRQLLRAWIPQISEFQAGTEYTVFEVDGVRIAPMICFDATHPSVAQGMAANGARLGLVMANLAWFGPTSVSDQFGIYVRFRALENRMPMLLLAQNGQSWLIDANGRDATPRLPQFESGAFVHTARAPLQGSFYSAHATAVHRAYLAALALVLLLGWRRELVALVRRRAAPRRLRRGRDLRRR